MAIRYGRGPNDTGREGLARVGNCPGIVANEVASTAATPAAQFKTRLEHGVLDTNLEAVLIGPAAPGGTVADLFGLGEQGRRWIAVRTADDLAKLPAPPDIRARIDAELQAGFAVFAVAAGPTDPVGWWRVDPRTGDTLSLGNRGWGQGMVEYKLVAASVGTFSMCSVGAYVVNGAYTARDRAICALAGLGTLAGGAGLPIVPMFGVTMSYSSLFFSTTVFSGLPVTIAAGTLLAVLADALVWGW